MFMDIVQRYYGKTFKSVLRVVNPFKKMIIKTECQVHRFINYRAIRLISKHEYTREFDFLNYYLEDLNRGVVWADQDFKSINHFYNMSKRRGLYGHSNAFELTSTYYNNAIKYWRKQDYKNSMFYLGACVHILQDLTIPQHVNIRLLDNHRQFENFVKLTYDIIVEFSSNKKPIVFDELEHYIRFNSKIALKIYKRFSPIKETRVRFYKIARCSLPLAQRTTAGCLLMFLKDVGYTYF